MVKKVAEVAIGFKFVPDKSANKKAMDKMTSNIKADVAGNVKTGTGIGGAFGMAVQGGIIAGAMGGFKKVGRWLKSPAGLAVAGVGTLGTLIISKIDADLQKYVASVQGFGQYSEFFTRGKAVGAKTENLDKLLEVSKKYGFEATKYTDAMQDFEEKRGDPAFKKRLEAMNILGTDSPEVAFRKYINAIVNTAKTKGMQKALFGALEFTPTLEMETIKPFLEAGGYQQLLDSVKGFGVDDEFLNNFMSAMGYNERVMMLAQVQDLKKKWADRTPEQRAKLIAYQLGLKNTLSNISDYTSATGKATEAVVEYTDAILKANKKLTAEVNKSTITYSVNTNNDSTGYPKFSTNK